MSIDWQSVVVDVAVGSVTTVGLWLVVWALLRPSCVFATTAVMDEASGHVRVKVRNQSRRSIVDLSFVAVVYVPRSDVLAPSAGLLEVPFVSPVVASMGGKGGSRSGFSHQILLLDAGRFFAMHDDRLAKHGFSRTAEESTCRGFRRLLLELEGANLQLAITGTDSLSSARRVCWSRRFVGENIRSGTYARRRSLEVLVDSECWQAVRFREVGE